MKTKLIYSDFDSDTHVSVATIQTKEGEFTGCAITHPDDYDIEGSFTGCDYAERRAEIKAMKMRSRFLKERTDAYKSLVTDVLNRTDVVSYETKVIIEYYLRSLKEYRELREQIVACENKLNEDMENRREKVETFLKKSSR